MTQEELNKACEIVRDLANEHIYGDWEQSCKFEDKFCMAMGAVIKDSLTPVLTWEDIRRIVEIADQMIQTAHDRVEWEDKSEEAYYTEVLRKFKEERK